MDIISNFFNFINSIIFTIEEGIGGILLTINALIDLFVKITYILPQPLYSTLISFLSIYLLIFTYKILRKG